jgi:hypothetical protein
MDKTRKAGKRAADAEQEPGTSVPPDDKGAMRDPAQVPGGEKGELGQVQKALEELEKEKGDWSKGGG